VVNAIRHGDYKVLYVDKVGKGVLAKLRAEARRRETARG
jgi:hypothetical protein